METWRNLARRKLRTFLTVLGITVGTLALVVMGAMSEKISLLVNGAYRYYDTRIIVQPKASIAGQVFGAPLSVGLVQDIKQMAGVKEAYPTLYLLYQASQETAPSVGLGFPPLVLGVDAHRFTFVGDQYPIVLSSGRFFTPSERKVAILGVDLARFTGAKQDGVLTIRGEPFQVVGIMERTLSTRDNIAFIPLADAQDFLVSSLPAPYNAMPTDLASEIEVYPNDLGSAAGLANVINTQIPGVRALPPGELRREFSQSLIIFNVIVVGTALIALVVGGLAILNTMTMSVSERTREIGIKKAIGASDTDVLREFALESAWIGFLGGVAGLLAGWALVSIINQVTARQGVVIFTVTPRLGIGTVLFATVLGAAAGFYPAWIAARRNPVDALRAE